MKQKMNEKELARYNAKINKLTPDERTLFATQAINSLFQFNLFGRVKFALHLIKGKKK